MADRKHKTTFELDVEKRKFDKKMGQTEGTFKRIKGSFNALKVGFIGFFAFTGIRALLSFTKQLGKLYSETVNLRKSFDILAHKEGLSAVDTLNKLREATLNTVSDMELLKNATQAKFLGIDIKNLPILLEFATKRAKDTGQSIDYLVQSIVTGIGRKSALILDNLGIQIKDLNKEVVEIAKEQGTWNGKLDENIKNLYTQEAAIRIAKRAIGESGETIDSFTDELDDMNTQWERFQTIMGALVSAGGIPALKAINDILREMGLNVDIITSKGIEKLIAVGTRDLKETEKALEDVNKQIEEVIQKQLDFSTLGKEVPKTLRDQNIALHEHKAVLEEDKKIYEDYINGLLKQIKAQADVNKEDLEAIEILKVKKETMEAFNKVMEETRDKFKTDFFELIGYIHELDYKQKDFFDTGMNGWETLRIGADRFSNLMSQVWVNQLSEGESFFSNLAIAAKQSINAIVAEILSKSFIFAIISSILPGSGIALGGWQNFIFKNFGASGLGTGGGSINPYAPPGGPGAPISSGGGSTNDLLRELIDTVKSQRLVSEISGDQIYTVLKSDEKNRL